MVTREQVKDYIVTHYTGGQQERLLYLAEQLKPVELEENESEMQKDSLS